MASGRNRRAEGPGLSGRCLTNAETFHTSCDSAHRKHIHRMRPTRTGWIFVIIAPLLLTCLVTLASLGREGGPSFPALHYGQSAAWLVWGILSVGVIGVIRRFPFGAGSSLTWLTRHVAAGIAFSVLAVVLIRLVQTHIQHRAWAPAPVIANLATGLLIYALVAASYQAIDYQRVLRTRETDAARLRADLAEARLGAIESKLQPHFLFNALNSIAALVQKDPSAAEAMIEQLSDLLRASLQADPMEEIPLCKVIQLAQQYLAIERVRYRDRLRVHFDISPAAQRCLVPQLMLQPLVENAVRHGIAPVEGGGRVAVAAHVCETRLVVTVEDDGVGYGNSLRSSGHGVGLGAVRVALMRLYGSAHQFDIRAGKSRGTVVSVEIPCRAEAM